MSSGPLWHWAWADLRPKDQAQFDISAAASPQDLVAEVERRITKSKGTPIKLNGENFFVRDLLEKVSRWIKKFVEVGDNAVQYDPGHAALPWAALRLVLQMSLNNLDKHAAVLDGIEKVSFYLAWSRIEERCLLVPFAGHDELEGHFVKLYTSMLRFMARSLRFLKNKPQRIASAFISSDVKYRKDVDEMAETKSFIDSYTRQISDQVNSQQSIELSSIQSQLADLEQPLLRIERFGQATSETIARWEQEKVLDWVSIIPFQKHFNVVHSRALAGTGQWLFQSDEMRAWKASSCSQILWLHGGAGSGKSTLLSMLVDSLIRDHNQHQAPFPVFFFCARNVAERERALPDHILRSLLRQLSDLPGRPALPDGLSKRYDKRREAGEVSDSDAVDLILDTIDGRPLSYIVVDALDECHPEERYILFDALRTILDKSRSLVKIFVTSRDTHADIQVAMGNYPALHIDATRNSSDINEYVRYSVDSAVKKRRLLPTERVTSDLQQHIENKLCDGADGMFRWVELQLKFLFTLKKRSVLIERLEKMPPGLERIYGELYEHSMEHLSPEEAEVVRRIFSWLLVAKRSLKGAELCQLVCAPEEPDMSPETMQNLCFDLVRIDTETSQFRFSHLSVREFLEKKQDEYSLGVLHNMATRGCIEWLLSGTVTDQEQRNGDEAASDGTDSDGTHSDGTHSDEAALDYASLYWPFHAEDAARLSLESESQQKLESFLGPDNMSFAMWSDVVSGHCSSKEVFFQSEAELRLSTTVTESGSALLVAACFGLDVCLEQLLQAPNNRPPVNTANAQGHTALHLAALYGHRTAVQVLLRQNADVNTAGIDWKCAPSGEYVDDGFASLSFGTPIAAAAAGGNEDIVKLLLDDGSSVGPNKDNSATPLSIAVAHGHMKVVKLLFERGASCERLVVGRQKRHDQAKHKPGHCESSLRQNDDTACLLCIALHAGHTDVAEFLMDHVECHAALCTASEKAQISVIRLLLAKEFYTGCSGALSCALSAASKSESLDPIRTVLGSFGNNEVAAQQCFDDSDALAVASENGSREMVDFCFDRFVQRNAQTHRKALDRALCLASAKGHLTIVQFLLAQGAHVNSRARLNHGYPYINSDLTCLLVAAFNGHTDVVELLLAHNAGVNAQCTCRFGEEVWQENALSIAAATFDNKVATCRLLLENGADVNAKVGRHGSALGAAAFEGKPEVLGFLIQHGANVNMQAMTAEDGLQTPLALAVLGYSHETVRILLESGADVNMKVRNRDLNCALDAAARGGNPEVFDHLLKAGAALNNLDRTLAIACGVLPLWKNTEIVEVLLDKGADVNARNARPGRPLSIASANGYLQIVELLLDRGADVHAPDSRYGNALCAAAFGHTETVELLLAHGADVHAKVGRHHSALIQAAASWHDEAETVKLLLSAGADVNFKGRRGVTALHLAVSCGNKRIANVLREHGAISWDSESEVLEETLAARDWSAWH